jgi:hypothetical protein
MAGAREHLCQQGEIQLALAVIKLARRANQQLSGGARLRLNATEVPPRGRWRRNPVQPAGDEQRAVAIGDRQLAFFGRSQFSSNSALASGRRRPRCARAAAVCRCAGDVWLDAWALSRGGACLRHRQ